MPIGLATFDLAVHFVDQVRRHTWGRDGGGSWMYFMQFTAWPLKDDIEQHNMVWIPCFHFVFVSECKLMSITAYKFLTNDVLVFVVHLLNDVDNTIAVCRYCDEFLFLCLRLCQLEGMFCHAIGINWGSLYLLSASAVLPAFFWAL